MTLAKADTNSPLPPVWNQNINLKFTATVYEYITLLFNFHNVEWMFNIFHNLFTVHIYIYLTLRYDLNLLGNAGARVACGEIKLVTVEPEAVAEVAVEATEEAWSVLTTVIEYEERNMTAHIMSTAISPPIGYNLYSRQSKLWFFVKTYLVNTPARLILLVVAYNIVVLVSLRVSNNLYSLRSSSLIR